MTKLKFALLRTSGYISPYTLGMVYPSHRRGAAFQRSRGHRVSPVVVQLPFGEPRWIQVWPPLLRFPSWVARKAKGRDAEGFVK